jgi:hypothetical protein
MNGVLCQVREIGVMEVDEKERTMGFVGRRKTGEEKQSISSCHYGLVGAAAPVMQG